MTSSTYSAAELPNMYIIETKRRYTESKTVKILGIVNTT